MRNCEFSLATRKNVISLQFCKTPNFRKVMQFATRGTQSAAQHHSIITHECILSVSCATFALKLIVCALPWLFISKLFVTYERHENGEQRLLREPISRHRRARVSRRGSIVEKIRRDVLLATIALRLVAALKDAPRRIATRFRERDSPQQHRSERSASIMQGNAYRSRRIKKKKKRFFCWSLTIRSLIDTRVANHTTDVI